jgi:hypothetical protein
MTFAECIVYSIKEGLMPPGGCRPGHQSCISEDDFGKLQAWLDEGAL